MKHTTERLVSALCCILIVAFAGTMIIFHFIMNDFIEDNAASAIETAKYDLGYVFTNYSESDDGSEYVYDADEEEDSSEPTTIAYWILVDENYYSTDMYYARKQGLVRWCKENPDTSGKVTYTEAGQNMYYVAQVKDTEDLLGSGGTWIIYADVTAEKQLMSRIDLSLLAITALCAAIAGIFGARIGMSIERESRRQKVFFENASHELKTPLMSIQGYAEGIYDGYFQDEKAAVSVIMNEADKMAALVDDILCLSRIESGTQKLNLEPVPLDTVINYCLISLDSVIKKRDLRVEMQPSMVTVHADAAQLDTAISNLLSNAVKYAHKLVVIRCDEHALSIWNDSEILSEDDLEHIFDRFYTGKNGGTGIGLALTKEIVNRHGWRISAEAADGGMNFTVSFAKHLI